MFKLNLSSGAMDSKPIFKRGIGIKRHINDLCKTIWPVALITLVLSFTFTACGNDGSALSGRWKNQSDYIRGKPERLELFKDGTGICDSESSISWKVEKKRLIIISTLFGLACDYSLSGSELTLFYDDGTSAIFKKIENSAQHDKDLKLDQGIVQQGVIMMEQSVEDKVNPMNLPGFAAPEESAPTATPVASPRTDY